jgi:hypothetical protein
MAKIHEEMLNILNHKGNANKKDIKISPHFSQKGYHTTTNAGKDVVKRKFLYCWWDCKLMQLM